MVVEKKRELHLKLSVVDLDIVRRSEVGVTYSSLNLGLQHCAISARIVPGLREQMLLLDLIATYR